MNTDELREALRRDAELAGRPPTDLVPRVAGLRRRSTRRRTGVVACACAIAAAVLGVSLLDGARGADRGAAGQNGSSAAVAGVDTEAAAARFRELVDGADSNRTSVIDPETLAEYLPNRQYRVINGDLTTLTDAVVVGHVTGVVPGRGFYAPEDDETATVEVPFDDPRAMWRTAHAELEVTEVLSGRVEEDTIVVGFGVGLSPASFDVFAAGLPALGDVVLFLQTSSPVYDYAPDIWSVAEDGMMLGEVDSDGRLTLPAIEPFRAERFLAANPTLDSLREAARMPTRDVPFETLED